MADASALNQFIGFGDSTLDSGYFRYHSTGNTALDQAIAAAVASGNSGAFVGNGVMNSTILAGKFGLSAAPIGGGGTNYAIGSAQTAISSPPVLSTVQQMQNYLTSVNGTANANGLYVIDTGDNDLAYVRTQGAAWFAANPTYLSGQASALAAEAALLQSAGARTLLVSNSYNYAVMAGLGGVITSGNAANYAQSVSYGESIWASLTAAGVRFVPVDKDSLFKYVVTNPAQFGFTAASVLASNAPCSVSAIVCTTITPAQQQTYLFVDSVHLTTAGQTIEADYEFSLLIAPSQISLLAESAVQNGLARTATIQRQIDLSGQRRSPEGFNAWMSAGAGRLLFKNSIGFPNASGTPFGGTAGVDFRTPIGIIVGAAVTAGDQSQRFSTGGHFDQMDEAPSLYAAYKAGGLWGDAVATYGLLQDHVVRQVTLGTFTDENTADTSGQSPALALRGGVDVGWGPMTTGPVAGMVFQRVHVNGFTETGTSGVTALSFGNQTRDSAVSQLGWRGAVDLGIWRPFAEMEWNHEWSGKNRSVTASLTTASVASFSMDAAPAAPDWATASVGASYNINSQMKLSGAFSADVANPRVTSYGGELGLGVSF
jgi:outer membrane lipase/esterase